METDIKIAQQVKLSSITEIAKKLNIQDENLELQGKWKAKINLKNIKMKKDARLILVSAISPTRSGEGKTTMAIALAQGLAKIDKQVCLALREPSLGPVFGLKGGATGGGYSQVLPMEEINLHFTGDFHAITSINNLIASVIDNHLYQGNELNIDSNQIFWKRALDLNDRVLRNIKIGFEEGSIVRDDHFIITVATEVMAIFCLSNSLEDFKRKIAQAIVALDKNGKVIRVSDLKIVGALAALVKEAIKPNLVQTNEKVPAIIHGGPFANIAHGCNSIIATKTALSLADYVVTEAGFGFDLGGEKFLDIKCRQADLQPSLIVLVVSLKALKFHGIGKNDQELLLSGLANNLQQHLKAARNYHVPIIITLNHFHTDDKKEIEIVADWCQKHDVPFTISYGHQDGGEGAKDFAKTAVKTIDESKNNFTFLYSLDDTPQDKIAKIAKKIYGAQGVKYSAKALEALKFIQDNGYQKLPICIAKTPLSLTDNPELLFAPENFDLNVSDLYVSAGAGFIVALTGKVLQMPGLPKRPAAEIIDVDEDGLITGLF